MDHLRRLRALARRLNRDDLGFDAKEIPHLKQAIDEERTAKEADLADLADAENELSDIEAMAASFAGGPEGNDGDQGDDQ